ncbi:hypothetical protein [Clostridium botulinum]|uniref:hypothetical protein n=1 Tax=Clostridium botulinum TaxID=1491 RepID=UPI003DA345A7
MNIVQIIDKNGQWQKIHTKMSKKQEYTIKLIEKYCDVKFEKTIENLTDAKYIRDFIGKYYKKAKEKEFIEERSLRAGFKCYIAN